MLQIHFLLQNFCCSILQFFFSFLFSFSCLPSPNSLFLPWRAGFHNLRPIMFQSKAFLNINRWTTILHAWKSSWIIYILMAPPETGLLVCIRYIAIDAALILELLRFVYSSGQLYLGRSEVHAYLIITYWNLFLSCFTFSYLQGAH